MKTQITQQTTAGAKGFAHAIILPLVIFIALAVMDTTREWSLIGAITYVLFASTIYGIKRIHKPFDEEASVFFTFAAVYLVLFAVFVFALILGVVA